jgi:hypothetical protein
MNNIISKLIAVTFPSANIEHLMEVINATPNPIIATEILCGIYQEPVIPTKVLTREYKGSEARECTFKSFDKWLDAVTYTYSKEKILSGYFPKGTLKEDITIDNFQALKEEWKSVSAEQVCIKVSTGEFVQSVDSCSLERWMSYDVVQ